MRDSKFLLLSVLLFCSFFISLTAQIELSTSGHVGIGGDSPDPSYDIKTDNAKFDGTVFFEHDYPGILVAIDGYVREIIPESTNYARVGKSSRAFNQMYSYGYYTPSDSRQKENIVAVKNSIDLIRQFQAFNYDLKSEYVFIDSINYSIEYYNILEDGRRNKIGYLAQDVEKILPQLVEHDDSTDTYSVNYVALIPILSEAIKEQQVLIESMQSEINTLKSRERKSLMSGTEGFAIENCRLFQNAPNPFGETTSIRYRLPEGISNADIIIYDMTGKQLKRIPLTESGESNIEVSGGEMDPGMYMYSMIVENQLIDTKQMVITN